MYIIYVKTIYRVYKKPYTGFTWSLGATNGINYWIFILGSGWVDPGWTQVRHWTHWLTQGLTLGQMVLSSWPDPIWPGQLGSGRRSTRVKRVLTWPAATLVSKTIIVTHKIMWSLFSKISSTCPITAFCYEANLNTIRIEKKNYTYCQWQLCK